MFVDMAVRGEDAGFSGVNVGEHHALEYIYPAPPVVLSSIGERTTRLRLGTAVTLLANLDALRIAEDAGAHPDVEGTALVGVAQRHPITANHNAHESSLR